MIDPDCCFTMCRSAAREHRYTDLRFTSCTFCQAGSSVVSIESSSGGEMPALLNAISTEPYFSAAVSKRWFTSASSVTSTFTKQPAELIRDRLAGVCVEVADHDRRALGGEPPRGGEADAARAAGDDRDLAGEALGEM